MKPAYRVPSLSEIRGLPRNGFTVASTFSGAGGSCLGYRMSGFRVAWANEFAPTARASYLRNADPNSVLDPRDIRVVRPAEVLAALGMREGELDVLDGSPPCQAFSTAGKREKGWGQKKRYAHGAEQCNEQLFEEYIRLLRGLMPKMFVAENVLGLVRGAAKGYFLEILAGLKSSGYRVAVRCLDAQWLGVPQSRNRLFFVGVREDLRGDPEHPKPLPYRYTVRDALPWVVRAEHDTSGSFSEGAIEDRPAPAVMAQRASTHFICDEQIVGNDDFEPVWGPLDRVHSTIRARTVKTSGQIRDSRSDRRRRFTIAELKRICSFPDDFEFEGSYEQQWEQLGNSVPPVMMFHQAQVLAGMLERAEGR